MPFDQMIFYNFDMNKLTFCIFFKNTKNTFPGSMHNLDPLIVFNRDKKPK